MLKLTIYVIGFLKKLYNESCDMTIQQETSSTIWSKEEPFKDLEAESKSTFYPAQSRDIKENMDYLGKFH